MSILICLLVGYFLGFIISYSLWGKTEGAVGILPNLRIKLSKRRLSIHHWMGFLASFILLLALREKLALSSELFSFLVGVCGGGASHGLTYKDRFKILN